MGGMGGKMKTKLKITFQCLPLAVLIFASACTTVYTAHGAYHRVRAGDTLATIAKKYRVGVQDFAEINNIEQKEDMKVGRSVYIPGVTPSGFAAILKKEGIVVRKRGDRAVAEVAAKESSDSPVQFDRNSFIWPVEGEVSSLFGMRHGRRHDGLDIRAKAGTPVEAAGDGEVVYSKRMRGYGNLVLVRHKGDYFTVYGHNSVNLVKTGAKVKKGQVIAKVGRTGRATGTHLHFEVREGAKARNPLFFLPKNRIAEKAKQKGDTDYAGGPDSETEGENP